MIKGYWGKRVYADLTYLIKISNNEWTILTASHCQYILVFQFASNKESDFYLYNVQIKGVSENGPHQYSLGQAKWTQDIATMGQAMEIEGSKVQKSKTSFYVQF